MEQAVQRNQRSKNCPAVQKIAEERVEIVGCKGKKSDEKQPMKIQSTALKTRKTVEMDHVRRRLSSSSNNVSNMRLDGAMGIPLQVQSNTTSHILAPICCTGNLACWRYHVRGREEGWY
jgi:hypothetical protein